MNAEECIQWKQMVQTWCDRTSQSVMDMQHKADNSNPFTYNINTQPPASVCIQAAELQFHAAVEEWRRSSSALELCNENIIMHLKWNVCGRKFPWNIHAAVIWGLRHIWEASVVVSTQRGVWVCLSHYCFIKNSYSLVQSKVIVFLCCGAPCWMIMLLCLQATGYSNVWLYCLREIYWCMVRRYYWIHLS